MNPFETALADLGITLTATFVPFSQSRRKDEEHPSLNWRVTLSRNGRKLLTTDYTQGCGHCPAYRFALGSTTSLHNDARIRRECETGKVEPAETVNGARIPGALARHTPIPPPTLAEVASALLMDSDVVDYPSFDSWASDFGYDPDSRAAEAIYHACREIANALIAGVGLAQFETLRELARECDR